MIAVAVVARRARLLVAPATAGAGCGPTPVAPVASLGRSSAGWRRGCRPRTCRGPRRTVVARPVGSARSWRRRGRARRPAARCWPPSACWRSRSAVPPARALRGSTGGRDARLERELPALLEAVARSLRSGAAIPTCARARPRPAGSPRRRGPGARPRRRRPRSAARRGARRVGADRPLPGVRLASGRLRRRRSRPGGTPARAVDGVAATLRERAEVDREVRALATQARASARGHHRRPAGLRRPGRAGRRAHGRLPPPHADRPGLPGHRRRPRRRSAAGGWPASPGRTA